MVVHVTAANASDSSQAGTVKAQAKAAYPDLESFTAGQGFAVRQGGPHTRWTANRTSPTVRKKGFVLIAFRWRVERTFAWLGPVRLLAKEYEKTVASAQAWIWCAMLRLLV